MLWVQIVSVIALLIAAGLIIMGSGLFVALYKTLHKMLKKTSS
ncbi:hypothetical protein Tfer_1126 [Thermincola ferriacetica]|uniref:Uncharacterized protein n=1 Tax=Thermincola ferriacetica TaxID=281456 RepID=A0A0L6W4D1_9FIRM|nr:hypothetical protein [Thermincola ferriacetica]KNZ70248.1 hypothetical protein Tfer_1126 [Thermincola ferriacetica]